MEVWEVVVRPGHVTFGSLYVGPTATPTVPLSTRLTCCPPDITLAPLAAEEAVLAEVEESILTHRAGPTAHVRFTGTLARALSTFCHSTDGSYCVTLTAGASVWCVR